jgi:WD40 repeat protein
MEVVVYEAGEILHRFDLASGLDKVRPTERVRGLAFGSDSGMLIAAVGDRVVALDLECGRMLWEYTPPRNFGFLIVSPVALSAHGGLIATSFDNGSVAIFGEDGRIRCLWSDNDAPRQLVLTESRDLIGCDSFTLAKWSPETRRKTHRHHLAQRAFGFAAQPSGEVVAIRTLRDVQVMRIDTGETLTTLPVQPGPPVLALHPHRPQLAIGGIRGAEVFGLDGQRQGVHPTDSPVTACSFKPDGRELAIGLASGKVEFVL